MKSMTSEVAMDAIDHKAAGIAANAFSALIDGYCVVTGLRQFQRSADTGGAGAKNSYVETSSIYEVTSS